jgi:hypothetical protein
MSVKFILAALVLMFVLMFSGCSNNPDFGGDHSNANQVGIAEGVTLQLTAPESSMIHQSMNQLLTITYQGNENQLLTQLELTEQGLNLVAVSLQGLPLFELVFVEGQVLQQKKYVEFDMLPLPYIISDIQLVYWPLITLNSALTDAVITEHKNGKERIIKSDGNVIISIVKGKDGIRYRHLQRGYQLTILPME